MADTPPPPITLKIADVTSDDLRFKSLQWREALGRLSEGRLEFLNRTYDDTPANLIGKVASIGLQKPDGSYRYFTGYIAHVSYGGRAGDFYLYRVSLRVSLWTTTLHHMSFVFQEKSVVDMIKYFLGKDPRIVPEFKLGSGYDSRKRELCIMYRETMFAFMSRLMEEEGIYYLFEHDESGHKLMLVDSSSQHCDPPDAHTTFQIGIRGQRSAEAERIYEFLIDDHSTFARGGWLDWNYTTPENDLLGHKVSPDSPNQGLGGLFYDFPGRFDTQDSADAYAQLRIEQLTNARTTYAGSSNAHDLRAGVAIKVQGAGDDISMMLTEVEVDLRSSAFENSRENDDEPTMTFDCRFRGQPLDRQFRTAPLTPRPRVYGPQTATVVGPDGDEIHVDALGRVKVAFRWDLVQRGDQPKELERPEDLSSCWIRVAQVWAGQSFGAVFVPRIGHEVVVEFLEGDPDRPLITGSVYNKKNTPPWVPEDHPTQSGIVTRSSAGGNLNTANSLVFEDKKGNESIAIHAERNMGISVEADSGTSIGHDMSVSVKHNRQTTIDVFDTVTVKQGRNTQVLDMGDGYYAKPYRVFKVEGKDYNDVTEGRVSKVGTLDHSTVTGDAVLNVSGTMTDIFGILKVGVSGPITVAATGLTDFKAGGSFNITAAGLQVQTSGKMEFHGQQFNRTIVEANDVVLGSNTNTYIGASSSTTIAGARDTFIGTRNEVQIALASTFSLGASVNTSISAEMNTSIGPRMEFAFLNLAERPLDVASSGIKIAESSLTIIKSGAPGGGSAGAGGMGPAGAFFLGFGAAANALATVANLIAAKNDVATFLENDPGFSFSALGMGMAATLLGIGTEGHTGPDAYKAFTPHYDDDPSRWGMSSSSTAQSQAGVDAMKAGAPAATPAPPAPSAPPPAGGGGGGGGAGGSGKGGGGKSGPGH